MAYTAADFQDLVDRVKAATRSLVMCLDGEVPNETRIPKNALHDLCHAALARKNPRLQTARADAIERANTVMADRYLRNQRAA